ncbi:hypothetical protein LTR29_002441 [Friedmanniomyces endolithicus]|nr:hypothetical protein LTR29_002441 [Friedmanniomyces endolithicus]
MEEGLDDVKGEENPRLSEAKDEVERGEVEDGTLLAAEPALYLFGTPACRLRCQEAQVKELYHKRVRTKCADEVRDFASCCSSRTFTATIMCRGQQKAMNTCMKQYATQDEQDSAREEWFATMDKRREEREQKEAKKKIDEVFWREWWAKDPNEKPGQTGKGGP